jgi:IgGFc binding protein
VAIEGNPGMVKGGPAGVPIEYTLRRGEHLQLTQRFELTGSIVSSDKKVGVFSGHQCLNIPTSDNYCDHAEQQLPPVNALGHEYVAVPHRPRTSAPDPSYWRIVATVAGTELSYDPPVDGPATLDAGEFKEFVTDTPFVVKSQDARHPFMLFSYMTSTGDRQGYGDPDFVRVVPSSQYLDRYVFFTDPTYSETNLVTVRKRTSTGFESVSLDCAGELQGWTPLGADYEYTRIDLVRHNFEPQGGCNNGARIMESKGPFGLTVWGWGGPETSGGVCVPGSTCYVSYGYPAGEGVRPINDVVVAPK